jgi:Uncharacterized conserved protein
MPYLLKTEPSEYSFAQLKKDKATVMGRSHESCRREEPAWHEAGRRACDLSTGNEKQTVGTATVVSVDDSKVKIKAGAEIAPTTLAEIKANKLFADSPLVRQGRLSVVPLSDAQYRALARK